MGYQHVRTAVRVLLFYIYVPTKLNPGKYRSKVLEPKNVESAKNMILRMQYQSFLWCIVPMPCATLKIYSLSHPKYATPDT